ncbi:hypothetical protein EXE55_18890 [Burkholderia glumae]|uniref:hypothetical protein n=1 Tax=Burkholderia glumae TaxID=337 RepID=UPI0002D3E933|nr:hypothetical protein [Burkholderia glumae]PJO21852.1 hypothetical protein Y5A_017425 [Burkholderia glumae AU6208]QHP93029.1 hypothetical protein EXE55_18890 [Burkholderia glumae]UVS99251.1 hypothetical protein EFP19_27060 [Burkholderia glumae]
MKIADIDAFAVMIRCQPLSQAAHELGVTQPAIARSTWRKPPGVACATLRAAGAFRLGITHGIGERALPGLVAMLRALAGARARHRDRPGRHAARPARARRTRRGAGVRRA